MPEKKTEITNEMKSDISRISKVLDKKIPTIREANSVLFKNQEILKGTEVYKKHLENYMSEL